MAFDPNRPFNDFPNLPPASETETKAILRSCIGARAALAELRISRAADVARIMYRVEGVDGVEFPPSDT